MPYEIRNKGGMFQVVKKDDNKVMGTHNNVEKAKKQIAAINANENK